MFSEIKSKYENFSDSLISEIRYYQISNIKVVEVTLKCMNSFNDYEYENIKLVFNDIIFFHFKEAEPYSSTVVNSALLSNENGVFIFDFFPLIYANYRLEENPESDFVVKSRRLSYIKLDEL